MGVLKSVEPTGFLAFAPAFAGSNWADVNRRIIQNCPHGQGRVLSSAACLVPALPAWGSLINRHRHGSEVQKRKEAAHGAASNLLSGVTDRRRRARSMH